MFRGFLKDESAATNLEYALVVAIVSVAAIGVMTSLGDAPTENFEHVGGTLSNATPAREGS